jgi:peptidoglycan L-alanyl-D-glutamate endopeptidase CwlK
VINSRNLDDLLPPVRQRVDAFLRLCKDNHVEILITSTYRDKESQDALYAQGRTTPGRIVTNAVGGSSFHNWRCAIDVVPIVNGKPVWDTSMAVWQLIGKLGKQAGLDWAGDWKTFKEYPHFQYTGGLTIAQLQAGNKVA